MAAAFIWCADHGTASSGHGSPIPGTGRVEGVDGYLRSSDNENLYSDNPITAGNNSFVKFLFMKITGANTVANGFFGHTSTSYDDTTIKVYGPGAPTGTPGSGAGATYTTPSAATNNTACPTNMSLADDTPLATNGVAVWFGITGPEVANKDVTCTPGGGADVYSNYIPLQMRTTSGAASSDTATGTFQLQLDVN